MNRDNSVLIFVELGPDKSILPISLECVTAGQEACGCVRWRGLWAYHGQFCG